MSTEKMALIIGINYVGTQFKLNGCINDAKNLRTFIMKKYNFKSNEIILLTDETIKPTKKNILSAFNQVILRKPKKLWFSYSGHGILQRDTNGDELTGQDSCLCPLDFNKSGFILDDDILNFLKKLPKTTTVFSLMDACHSGTILDLPFTVDTNNVVKQKNSDKLKDLPNIVMISGCRDNETSEDAFIDKVYTGAMTWSFFEALKVKQKQNNFELCNNMFNILKNKKFSQFPLLSVSYVELKDSQFNF